MKENLMKNVADVTEEAVEAVAESSISTLTKIAGVGIGTIIIGGITYAVVKHFKNEKSKEENEAVIHADYTETEETEAEEVNEAQD